MQTNQARPPSSRIALQPNPALTRGFNAAAEQATQDAMTGFDGLPSAPDRMTLEGTVSKTALMLTLVVLGGAAGWWIAGSFGLSTVLLYGSMGIAFVLAMVTAFKPRLAPTLGSAYAVVEGVFLGMVSYVYDASFDGIVGQAVGLTLTIFVALLLAYKSGRIKATENFRLGVTAATGGIMLFYLVSIGARLLFDFEMPLIHDSGLLGIGFSLVVVAIASANLVLDFDFIEHGVERGLPKHMEWYGAFGLTVTLAWLYLELLRLLSKLRD